MMKRTSLFLDTDLVAEAACELDTSGTTETVRAALQKTVRQARLRRLAEHEFPATFPVDLAEQRAPRTFGT